MIAQIKMLKIESYDQQIAKQQDELSMLRAQIRPHFYINAVTTISNMTYDDRNADIRRYVSALTKYMRYMLSLKSDYVTVSDELRHIENYIEMQKIKMPDSVDAHIQCDDAVSQFRVPYLIIFTVVENTFKHAADLYKTLLLRIQCEYVLEENFQGCKITVSDNGKGFSPEVIAHYSEDQELPALKDHFGLTNIIRTLQLTYRRHDLLTLYNASEGGAVVEIRIPEEVKETNEDTDRG